jgi:hypothetical protein
MILPILLSLLFSQLPDSPLAKPSPPPDSSALELQGDKLGESLETFLAKHPKAQCDDTQKTRTACYQWVDVSIFGISAHPAASCSLKNRYAKTCLEGLNAKFSDHQLIALVYSVVGTDKSAASAELQKKLGKPAIDARDATVWNLADSTASVIVGKATESPDDPTILTVTISRSN